MRRPRLNTVPMSPRRYVVEWKMFLQYVVLVFIMVAFEVRPVEQLVIGLYVIYLQSDAEEYGRTQ